MTKYLDENGLAYFWTKIKAWLSSHAPVKYFGYNWNVDTNDDYALVVGNGADENNPNDSFKIMHDGDIIIGDGSGGDTTIYHQAQNRLGDAITFMSNDTDATGDGIKIGNGGVVIVGSGESASNTETDLNIDPSSEKLYLTSDEEMVLLNNVGGSRKAKASFYGEDLSITGAIQRGSIPQSTMYDIGGYKVLSADSTSWMEFITRAYSSGVFGGIWQVANKDVTDWNVLGLFFDQSGNKTVTLDAVPWRKTLGLGTNGNLPITIAQGGSGHNGTQSESSVANMITAASGITITDIRAAFWGKVCTMRITWKRNSAISVPANGDCSNITIGTLKKYKAYFYQYSTDSGGDGGNLNGKYYTDSNGTVSVEGFDGTGSARTIAANTAITFCMTYLML